MGKAEELHELIYTNLCLLKSGGHHIIDFKQGMFKEPNLPGFEAVGYALLMIIDPAECKSKIPWPLVNDKAQTREFRTNFSRFIKMINNRYPDAQIPEITASSLQFPSGINFLYFMYKLSTFALEIELKKTLSNEEHENLLPKPTLSKQAKDQQVKLMIVKGALRKEEESLLQFKEYETSGPLMLEKMNCSLNDVTKINKSSLEQLKSVVASLNCDDKNKESLIDIEDSTAITVYNEEVERKWDELERNCCKLNEIRHLAAQCYEKSQNMKTYEETNCLDGHKSTVNTHRHLSELAGGPIVNMDGDVKLLEIFRAACTAATRLTRSSGAASLLPLVYDLQAQSRAVAMRVQKVDSALRRLHQENNKAVLQLRPTVYSTLKIKKYPDAFKYLKERPALNFVLPQSLDKKDVALKPGRKRKSFGSIINRRNKVVCSIKSRREPKKHASSTPFFKTPACRKSLYNTLPSGSRHKQIKEDRPLEVTPDIPIPVTPFRSFKQESGASEPSTFNSYSTNETSSPQQPSPVFKCGRKSLNDLVERFLKLKRTMNLSSDSKNESDTCNEHES